MNRLANRVLKFAAVAVVCGFAAEAVGAWTYDETAQTVTDGNWTFNVSGDRDALVIGRATGAGSTGVIDFTTGIEGGYAFGEVMAFWMWKNNASYPEASAITEVRFADSITVIGDVALCKCANLTTVRLPANLQRLGTGAFDGCSKLASVSPLLPDSLEYVGTYAFRSCSALKADVVLRNKSLVIGEYAKSYSYSAFYKSGILSCDLSESGITATPIALFRDSPNLRCVKYPETLTSVGGQGAHYNCSSLMDVQFNSFPTWPGDMVGATPSHSAGGRITYPANNTDWQNYVNGNPTFTAWSQASESDKAAYENAFPDGPTPVGYATIAGSDPKSSGTTSRSKWLVPIVTETAECELNVVSEPGNLAVGSVVPGYGAVGVVGSSVGFSVAAEYAACGDQVYRCKGYKIGKPNGLVEYGDMVESLSGTFDPAGKKGSYYICWQWEVVAHRVAAVDFPEHMGTVSVDEPCFRDFEGFYPVGQTVTVRAASKGAARFERWLKDRPAGCETDNPLTLTVDSAKMLLPYFSDKWVLNDAGTSMTDGYWTFPVSGSREALTVNKPNADGTMGLVDLRKGIEGGGAVVAIGASLLYANSAVFEVRLPDTVTALSADSFRECPNMEKVVLPSQLETIGSAAFYRSGKLSTVEPEMLPPTVTYVGWAAFNGCGILQDLVLHNPKVVLGNSKTYEENSTFRGSGILSADLTRTRLTEPLIAMFRACPNLKCIKYPKTLNQLSGCGLHYQSSKLADIQFQSWPSNFATQTDAFGGTTGNYKGRIVYPKGDPDWTAYIAEQKAANNFIAWADAGDNTNTYLNAFSDNWRPIGYVIVHKGSDVGNVGKWLVPHNFNTGTMVLFR